MNKWDTRFIELAKLVSSWSKDPKHKVGAVVADSFNRILSIGYNGPPRSVIDSDLSDSVKKLRSLHAELNAILNCNSSLNGASIYVYPFSPCAQCAAAIIQKQLGRVVYYKDSCLKTWEGSQNEALVMFEEASITVRRYL